MDREAEGVGVGVGVGDGGGNEDGAPVNVGEAGSALGFQHAHDLPADGRDATFVASGQESISSQGATQSALEIASGRDADTNTDTETEAGTDRGTYINGGMISPTLGSFEDERSVGARGASQEGASGSSGK